ncbi:MAG: cyclic nucleotide-binding domain-containing protein [bacterium]|nr:cyclic nucleotide-binding domain-containing protein [bacterium]
MDRMVSGTPNLQIGIAESDDIKKEIYRFRYSIYVEEMGKKLQHSDDKHRIIKDQLDDSCLLLYARSEEKIVATMRLNSGDDPNIPQEFNARYGLSDFSSSPPREILLVSKLMVAEEFRGTTPLAKLLYYSYRLSKQKGIRLAFCNCAPSLVQMYEHLGFRRYKDNFMDPEVGYRIPLVLVLDDIHHLKAARSPFYRLARQMVMDPAASGWFQKAFPAYAGYVNKRLMTNDLFWTYLTSRLHDEDVFLLRDVGETQARRFLTSGTVLNCKAGDVIVREADVGNEMFVMLQGNVEVVRFVDNQKHSIAILGRGEVFGEISYLSKLPRTATVIAISDVEVLALSQAFLQEVMKQMPETAAQVLFNLSLILCKRVRAYSQRWVTSLHRPDIDEKET